MSQPTHISQNPLATSSFHAPGSTHTYVPPPNFNICALTFSLLASLVIAMPREDVLQVIYTIGFPFPGGPPPSRPPKEGHPTQ
jgi:hypothetical protein